MSNTRQDVEDGAAWARRALRKPEPPATERKPTQAERIAAWSARNREDESKATQTRAAVEQTRRDLHTPGSAFTVGAERYAADGSRWQRVA
jgi:hypothetical protein